MHIIRAIDVGYGNIKFTLQAESDGSPAKYDMFPALAPDVGGNSNFSVGGIGRVDTFKISVNGTTFEVGKDAHLAQSSLRFGRQIDADYPASDAHLALILGAVCYMGLSHIDTLVLGLPLSTYQKHWASLEARTNGKHALPDGKSVVIDQVIVVPQPIGGFYDYAVSHGKLVEMNRQNNLTIDPGFNTLDWLITEGRKIDNRRSGAAMSGGMVRILSEIERIISEEVGDSIGDMTRLDSALLSGKPLRVRGEDIDLKKYSGVVRAATRESVNRMSYKIGSDSDIDNIVVVGGGALFFAEAIREKFKKHQIYIGSSPVYANVRGFQLIGEEAIGV